MKLLAATASACLLLGCSTTPEATSAAPAVPRQSSSAPANPPADAVADVPVLVGWQPLHNVREPGGHRARVEWAVWDDGTLVRRAGEHPTAPLEVGRIQQQQLRDLFDMMHREGFFRSEPLNFGADAAIFARDGADRNYFALALPFGKRPADWGQAEKHAYAPYVNLWNVILTTVEGWRPMLGWRSLESSLSDSRTFRGYDLDHPERTPWLKGEVWTPQSVSAATKDCDAAAATLQSLVERRRLIRGAQWDPTGGLSAQIECLDEFIAWWDTCPQECAALIPPRAQLVEERTKLISLRNRAGGR